MRTACKLSGCGSTHVWHVESDEGKELCASSIRVFSLSLQVAVAGCCHGHLDGIYSTLLLAQEREGVSIDVLLCCGDFQVHYTTIMAALDYQ